MLQVQSQFTTGRLGAPEIHLLPSSVPSLTASVTSGKSLGVYDRPLVPLNQGLRMLSGVSMAYSRALPFLL